MDSSLHPFIQRKVIVLTGESTSYQAARAMCENQVGCVMVSDHEGHILGILTDRDLVCRVAAAGASMETRIAEIMTPSPVHVNENSSLTDVISAMAAQGVRRIPVFRELRGGHQRCVGVVSLDDLLAAESLPPAQSGQIVRSQIWRRYKPHLHTHAATEDSKSKAFLDQLVGELGISRPKAMALSKFIFGTIARRLHYSAAVQWIKLLPSSFRLELLDLPAGPDRSISARDLEVGVEVHLHTDQAGAQQALQRVWRILEGVAERGGLNHIAFQLPEEMRALFQEEVKYARLRPDLR